VTFAPPLLRCIVCSHDDAVLVQADLLVPVECCGSCAKLRAHELHNVVRRYARAVRTEVVWIGRSMYQAIVRAERHCVVRGSPRIGVHIRCRLLLLMRWLLRNRVHGLVQDEWQGGDTGFSAKLRSRLGQQCALCCARMRVKCTRLSIRVATRMHGLMCEHPNYGLYWFQRQSWHCADPRVMDVLLGLTHRWRRSGEPYIPVCPAVGRNLSEIVSGRYPTTRLLAQVF
jgi:hypothetical protein